MRTRKIEPNTYMLTDALVHVNRFLLIGGERALLLDTGYGEESMTRRLRRLTGLPLVVANTHLHPDHSDGNKLFGEVFVGEADLPCRGMPSNETARSVAAHFKTNTKVPRRIVDKVLNYGLIDTGTEKYSPMPDVFELGGRTIETLPCPGHTPGSTLFLDSAARCVFAGDAINPGFWAFTSPGLTLSGYAELWLDLAARLDGYERIWISHHRHPLPIEWIGAFATALKAAVPERSKPLDIVGGLPETVHIFKYDDEKFGAIRIFAYPSQMR